MPIWAACSRKMDCSAHCVCCGALRPVPEPTPPSLFPYCLAPRLRERLCRIFPLQRRLRCLCAGAVLGVHVFGRLVGFDACFVGVGAHQIWAWGRPPDWPTRRNAPKKPPRTAPGGSMHPASTLLAVVLTVSVFVGWCF